MPPQHARSLRPHSQRSTTESAATHSVYAHGVQIVNALCIPILGLSLLMLSTGVAGATSYVMPTDQNLLDKSSLVVVGVIEAKERAPVFGNPATDYQVRVEQVLKGFVLATDIVVRVPGGVTDDGLAFAIYGAPRFESGTRAVLFLTERDDVFEVSDLELGAFIEGGVGANRYAYRNVSASEVVSDSDPYAAERRRSHLPRNFLRFTGWLAKRAAGIEGAADYFMEATPNLVGTRENFGQVVFGCNQGDAIGRWTQFDQGQSISYRMFSGGQPGVSGGGFTEVQRGIGAWNGVSSTTVDLRYGGQTSSNQGGGDDNVDGILRIIPEDPNNLLPGSFVANQGGTLYATLLFTACSPFLPFQGLNWVPIFDADIVGQDGFGANFLPNQMSSPLAFERVVTHEIGHGIGMGHSCGNGVPCTNARGAAIMRPDYVDSLLGSALGQDDKAGIRFLYPTGSGGGGSPPAAPTNLVATAMSQTEIMLTWNDNATDETGHLLQERAVSSSDWIDLGTLAANSSMVIVEGIPGKTARVYQVAASNSGGASAFSNEAQATTHAPIAPCVSDNTTLCIGNDRFEVNTRWVTQQATSGNGNQQEITADTGYFTFFDPNNVEAVVKVINACGPFNRFWIFAGGLTNVQVELTVVDTQTGLAKTYFNALDTPFAPVQDTDAFATCP